MQPINSPLHTIPTPQPYSNKAQTPAATKPAMVGAATSIPAPAVGSAPLAESVVEPPLPLPPPRPLLPPAPPAPPAPGMPPVAPPLSVPPPAEPPMPRSAGPTVVAWAAACL